MGERTHVAHQNDSEPRSTGVVPGSHGDISLVQRAVRMQRAAGNRATGAALGRAATPGTDRRPDVRWAVQRDDRPDPGTGEMDVKPEPLKEEMDAFLASRVDLFEVIVVGDEYTVLVDRAKNPWTQRYTPPALASAAMAALIRRIGRDAPSPLEIREATDEVLETSGGRFRLRTPAVLGPPAVQPFWQVSMDADVVDRIMDRLGLLLSKEGWALQRSLQTGSFISEALRQVAQNFGSVRPRLPADVLDQAEINEQHVFNMLVSDATRRAAAELMKTHKLARPLVEGSTLAGSTGATDVRPDWSGLAPDTWGELLADVAVDIVERAGVAALERRERERRHRRNEALRPYELDVPVTKALSFILDTYDPASTVTVNFLGPVKVQGGQRITNAKGQTLFILRASHQVIYQNLSDLKFYRQAASGIEEELRFGVFALVAEKTKHIIPITKFMFRVLGVIFPPVGAVMLSTTVLNAASNLAEHADELKAGYDNLRIIQENIEGLVPGITDAVLELVTSNLDAAALVLLDPKYAELAWDEWLVLVLDYAIAGAGGGVADVAGKAAVGFLKKTWAVFKKVAAALATTLRHAYKVGRPVLVGAGRGGKHWDLERVRKAAAELEGIGLADAYVLASNLLALSSEQADQLLEELGELGRVGGDLITTVTKVFAW